MNIEELYNNNYAARHVPLSSFITMMEKCDNKCYLTGLPLEEFGVGVWQWGGGYSSSPNNTIVCCAFAAHLIQRRYVRKPLTGNVYPPIDQVEDKLRELLEDGLITHQQCDYALGIRERVNALYL